MVKSFWGQRVKLGIPLLVVGIILLLISIPYSLWSIMTGALRLFQSDTSGGVWAYAPIIGVIAGFLLTAIGVTRVFGK